MRIAKLAFLFFGLLSLFLFCFLAWLIHHRGYLFKDDDPLGYYVYVRSLVHDGDLDFRNEYDYFRKRGASLNFSLNRPNPVTGRADNQYTAGFPFWS